jgi:hypothetical protein
LPSEDFATHPDLARAAFAAADFVALAKAAPGLFQMLLDQVQGTRPAGDQIFDLSHPAWLAAVAALAPGTPAAVRTALHRAASGWLKTRDAQSMTQLLVNDVAAKGAFRNPSVGLAVTIVALADRAIRPIPLLHKLLEDDSLAVLAVPHGLQAATDWRREVLLIARRRRTGALLVRGAAGVPLLHPAVLSLLQEAGAALSVADLPEPDGPALAALAGGGHIDRLSDVTRIASALDKLLLRIVPAELPPTAWAAMFPGRLPEFHAPLRLLLTDAPAGPGLADALARATAPLPWWPSDIAPEPLGRSTLGPTLAGTLVDLLDRAGHLPDLARALAELADPTGQAARLSGLIDNFCTMSRPDQLAPP